jgi:hypothetical protein
MEQMTKFKRWSMQVYVADWCSSFCEYQFFYYVNQYSVAIMDCFGSKCTFMFWRHPSPSVLIPALRTVGNIVTGDDTQTQVMS